MDNSQSDLEMPEPSVVVNCFQFLNFMDNSQIQSEIKLLILSCELLSVP